MAIRTRISTPTGCLWSSRRHTRNTLPGTLASTARLRQFCSVPTLLAWIACRITTGQTSQTYSRITQARSDGNNARVWGGMHYPSTVTISSAVGSAIARHVDRTAMQRLHGRHD